MPPLDEGSFSCTCRPATLDSLTQVQEVIAQQNIALSRYLKLSTSWAKRVEQNRQSIRLPLA